MGVRLFSNIEQKIIKAFDLYGARPDHVGFYERLRGLLLSNQLDCSFFNVG